MGALKSFLSRLPLLLHCAPLVLGRVIPVNDTISVAPEPGNIITKNRAFTDYNDCTPDELYILERAVNDVDIMLDKAIKRLDKLTNLIKQEPKKPSDTTPEALSTWKTFRALFGNPYHGPGREQNKDGLAAVKDVSDTLTNMHGAMTDLYRPRIEIWCDEGFLKKKGADGTDLPEGQYFDDRPLTDGGQRIVVSPIEMLCSNPNTEGMKTMAYVTAPELLSEPYGKDVTLVVFCKWKIKDWEDHKLSVAPRLLQSADLIGTHIDKIAEHNPIVTVLHEFTHCDSLMYPKKATADFSLKTDGTWSRVVTWKPSVKFARIARNDARRSAENIAYFITTMFYDKWHWKAGYAAELPSTAEDEPDFGFD